MAGGRTLVSIHSALHVPPSSKPFDLSSIAPQLLVREAPALPEAPPRRTRIWEFNSNLHCSIIGTCLSTGELRQVLKKLGVASASCTDHELHGLAVTLAGRHDTAAKQLNKALDQRHKLAVSQFSKAGTEAAVLGLWDAAVRRGEIPSAYWATLTHPQTTQAIIRQAFGEVHMLSHLVGSATRADLRRLSQLEAEKAELQARLDRQQLALRDAVVKRDEQIRALRDALAQRLVSAPDRAADNAAPLDGAVLSDLVADLERRLARQSRRRTTLDERHAATQSALARERAARLAAERECDALRRELGTIEASLGSDSAVEPSELPPQPRLDGSSLLYVGGRPNQVGPMRAAVERLGGTYLHHDGGMENHAQLLPGLVSRSDCVLFPVDCISHEAANIVKALCRQSGKRFMPLRSASVTSLLAALRELQPAEPSDAAA